MNIQAVNGQNYRSNTIKSTPTFGAIHPCLYYLKTGEDSYKLITDADLIKNNLQRKLITWLNHNYNARIKVAQGNFGKPKAESMESKALRERLVRFFVNRDSDYRVAGQDKAASYFNTDNTTGLLRSYIFTGPSVSILESLGDKIKNVQHQIKVLTRDLQDFYRLKYIDAKDKAAKELEPELMAAKSTYHETVMRLLQSKEAKSNPKNTMFSAFFEAKTKGKKTTYELINAKFEPRLV